MKPERIDEARDALKEKLRWADEMPGWVSWGMRFAVIWPDEPKQLLAGIMVDLELAGSKAEARRSISAGEVRVAGDVVRNSEYRVASGHYIVTRGKRRAGRVISSLQDLPPNLRHPQISELDNRDCR